MSAVNYLSIHDSAATTYTIRQRQERRLILFTFWLIPPLYRRPAGIVHGPFSNLRYRRQPTTQDTAACSLSNLTYQHIPHALTIHTTHCPARAYRSRNRLPSVPLGDGRATMLPIGDCDWRRVEKWAASVMRARVLSPRRKWTRASERRASDFYAAFSRLLLLRCCGDVVVKVARWSSSVYRIYSWWMVYTEFVFEQWL